MTTTAPRAAMDAVEALQRASCLEFRLGAGAGGARIECFAIPRRRGSARRRSQWVFLVVTDLPEVEVRDGLQEFEIEMVGRRNGAGHYVAWPPDPQKGADGRGFLTSASDT